VNIFCAHSEKEKVVKFYTPCLDRVDKGCCW
jgi:hypothetical protein